MTMGYTNLYQLSFLVTKYKSNSVWILYNWLDTQNIQIEDELHPLYKILESNQLSFQPFEIESSYSEFEYLLENKFIVTNQDETREIVEKKYAESNSKKKLELILMVANEACNLNCVYCYEDHSQKQKMGLYEQNILKKFIESHSLTNLGIDYFGGEPLLNSDFILTFNEMMIELAKTKQIKFASSITTNGYLLTRNLFENLVSLKITNYQITIDGLKEDHDKLRPLKNGKGTFDKIYSNLIEISKIPSTVHFSITIRINFNQLTATKEKRAEFLNLLKSDFGNDNRFLIHPHSIGNWKKEEDLTEFYMSSEMALKLNDEYDNEVQSLGFNSFNMINYGFMDSNSCYADKSNNLVVFPASLSADQKSLKVQKCTVALSNPINTSGYISENGELIANTNWHHWVKASPFKKEGCKTCFFVLNCYGSSCPLNTILNNGEVTCPKEKKQEIEIAKKIVEFTEKF